MSIFSRASLFIIAISAPTLAIGNPGYYYYPSYYPPNNPYEQDSPPYRDYSPEGAKAKVNLLEYNLPATPGQARPAYVQPAYAPPTYGSPAHIYQPPTTPTMPAQPPPDVGPDQAYDLFVDTPAYNPPDGQAYKPLADTPTYKLPEDSQSYKPPVETPVHEPPNAFTTPTKTATNPPIKETPANILEHTPTYHEPTPPKWGQGKPSPMPNRMDRRNTPRVPRQKIGKTAKGTTPREGHTRRFTFLKKRQQVGQHTVVPVTVNMITGIGHSPSTSSVPTATTTNVLPPSLSPFAPGLQADASQAALSLHSNPEATMPSIGGLTPPVSSNSGDQHFADLDTGEPRNKAAIIASILSVIVGLVVIITVVKLTSNAMRKRKHAAGLGKYDEHLSSKEGLIPEMCEEAHFETHDVIITRPDGSEISPLSSDRGDSPSPPPFGARGVGRSPPPLPMPTFAPPPAPTSPLSLPYVKLLSPSVNLAQQNMVQSRVSATSETMSMSTTSTDISEGRSASDGEGMGRQVSHRRMRSAPGSVVWSARSSGATGRLTTGLSGEEGYWESVDVCGSESVGRLGCRTSRRRSVAMSVMW